jgi:large subunit ribosomal protein L15
MQIHQLKKPNQRSKKRIGRGGKRGTYSGHGIKGQNARAGKRKRPATRDLIQKIPKLRGVLHSRYKKQGVKQFKAIYKIVNLDILEKKFKEGEVVSPQSLLEKKLVRRIKGKIPHVKILGRGELKKKLVFEGVEMSEKVKKLF